jgi:hypothetical protein
MHVSKFKYSLRFGRIFGREHELRKWPEGSGSRFLCSVVELVVELPNVAVIEIGYLILKFAREELPVIGRA